MECSGPLPRPSHQQRPPKPPTKFAETVPTTLAGLAAQIAFAPYCFGQVNSDDDDWTEPGNYSFGNWLCDDREDALCRSMQAGIKQIAGGMS